MTINSYSVEAMFRERAPQLRAWGIPARIVAHVAARVEHMGSDTPGSWVYEWAARAEQAERHDPRLAAALWGAARFPIANCPSRRRAQERQVASFLAAAPRFGVPFERRMIDGRVVHLYGPYARETAPLVLLSGGFDTFKIELHRLAVGLARAGLAVAAMDMPGTGESGEVLTPDAESAFTTVLATLAGDRPRAMLGISFGGHWATKLALLGAVDAAVNVGGPVGARPFSAGFVRALPNGMPESIAHAHGYTELPEDEVLARRINEYSLRRQGLLAPARLRKPLLVLNGDRDPYVPLSETTVFRAFPSAEVKVLAGLGHCAGDKFLRVAPFLVTWLRARLSPSPSMTLMHRATRLLLPTAA